MSLKVVLGENGSKVTIGDKEFELSPLTLGDIAEAEEKFGCDMSDFGDRLKKMGNIIFLIFLSLKEKHPEMTEKAVGKMFKIPDMAQINDVLSAIMGISGMVAEPKNESGTAGV